MLISGLFLWVLTTGREKVHLSPPQQFLYLCSLSQCISHHRMTEFLLPDATFSRSGFECHDAPEYDGKEHFYAAHHSHTRNTWKEFPYGACNCERAVNSCPDSWPRSCRLYTWTEPLRSHASAHATWFPPGFFDESRSLGKCTQPETAALGLSHGFSKCFLNRGA